MSRPCARSLERRLASVTLAVFATTLVACSGSRPGSAPRSAGALPSPAGDPETAGRLRAAVASTDRPAEEAARDKWRHPVETLEAFGIDDRMTVVELWPGAGWYTAILAPFLADKGELVVTNLDPNGPADAAGADTTRFAKKYAERLASKPALFGKVKVRTIHPADDLSLGPDGSADLVVTFRNFHNWIHDGIADKVLAAAFRVLRSGGTFGLEEHRAKEGADPATIGATGYVPEAYVIALVEKAGFVLEAKSEVNANPRDTKDWPAGVWTLPPTLRLGAQDRAKYEAIGESDRMTLRFRKR